MSFTLRRHWKWLILPAIMVVFVTVGGVVVGAMKGSEAYALAIDAVRQSPAANEALGAPIEDGFFPQGSIQTSGSSGQAEMAIGVSGTKGSGTLHMRAVKERGEWSLTLLILDTGTERRDLLAGADGS